MYHTWMHVHACSADNKKPCAISDTGLLVGITAVAVLACHHCGALFQRRA